MSDRPHPRTPPFARSTYRHARCDDYWVREISLAEQDLHRPASRCYALLRAAASPCNVRPDTEARGTEISPALSR